MPLMFCQIKDLKPSSSEAQYAIVRSLKNPIRNTQQLACLSPSRQLFWDYLDWKKKGFWNQDVFRTLYAPRFLRELKENPEAHQAIRMLLERDRNGETIRLACFCSDETLCHRILLAGILKENGADTRTLTLPPACGFRML